jgi:acetyltransferase-like isoleucine patch superfamily enzyme
MDAPAKDVLAFLCALECAVSCPDEDFRVSGLAHVEDGLFGRVCWWRRQDRPAPRWGVVISRAPDPSVTPAQAWATHPNPRMVLRRLIERFLPSRDPKVSEGKGCRIHPSAVLGADGQGYDWEGQWEPFPHAGGIRMGDDVDVGPQATIMRGSIGDTVVGTGTKIGNHVNIGHDTRIGDHVLVIAGASLAGWVRVEDHVKIWQGAIIKNGVHIGHHAEIAMGSVVLTDVPAGEVWAGNPAKRIR